MAVEIQTLIFAREIREYPDGLADLLVAPIFRMEPENRRFPTQMPLSFYLLLRKEAYDSSVPIRITLKVTDEDLKAIRLIEGESFIRDVDFQAGERFFGIVGRLTPTFERPGEYSIQASVESDGHRAQQIYVINVFVP